MDNKKFYLFEVGGVINTAEKFYCGELYHSFPEFRIRLNYGYTASLAYCEQSRLCKTFNTKEEAELYSAKEKVLLWDYIDSNHELRVDKF